MDIELFFVVGHISREIYFHSLSGEEAQRYSDSIKTPSTVVVAPLRVDISKMSWDLSDIELELGAP
jgi:hypothetical protein